MGELANNTIQEIEEKKISPQPKWHFLLKNYSFWLFFALAAASGALAVSTIVFMLKDNDWNAYAYMDRSLLIHIIACIPYFWIFVFTLFVLFAYNSLKHTKGGYKHEMYKLVLGIIGLSAAIGLSLFFGGLNFKIHETFSEYVPFYDALTYDKKDIWNNASRGLLGGEIIDVRSSNDFTLKDLSGKMWKIQGQNLVWFSSTSPQTGEEIKLIGSFATDSIFSCKTVRPWNER